MTSGRTLIESVTEATRLRYQKRQLSQIVSSEDVLDAVLVAARLQAEKYIEKLSRGSELGPKEISALKCLAEIAKSESAPTRNLVIGDKLDTDNIKEIKKSLYATLAERTVVIKRETEVE